MVEARLPELKDAARAAGCGLEIGTSPRDLRTRVARARDRGVGRVAIAGGDGSIHHAIQELVGSDTALAPIPLGRGNDFAASVGIPEEFSFAMTLALEGRTRAVDVGRAGDTYFAVNCGAGVDSLAAQLANRQRVFGGSLGYPLAAAAALAGFRRTEYSIDFDGVAWKGPGMALIVANCWRFGGGMKIAPEAKVDDGLLDLVWIKKAFKPRLLPLLAKVYKGTHLDHPAVSMARSARVEFCVSRKLPLYGDGEPMEEVGKEVVTVEVVPQALHVVAPG